MTRPYSRRDTATGSTPFGDRLKQERIRRGFTVVQFAAECEASASQVTGPENRGVVPRTDLLVRMADVLDCSVDWLLGLEDDDGKKTRRQPDAVVRVVTAHKPQAKLKAVGKIEMDCEPLMWVRVPAGTVLYIKEQ